MVNLNSTATRTTPAPNHGTARATLYSVLVLAMIVVLAAFAAAHGLRAYIQSSLAEREMPLLTASHNVTIGAQRYVLPAGLLTDPVQRRDGFAERIDLMMALPIGPGGRLAEVDIVLMPRGRVRTSATLLDTVYLHQFASEHLSGPPGLVGKPLALDAGTRGETVWYDPLTANPFVAKCMAPLDARDGARTCLRVFPLSDRNTAIVSFDLSVLANWRSFDAGIENAIAMMRL